MLVTLMVFNSAAQEVVEESNGLFSTRQQRVVVPMGIGDEIVIRAASTLRGTLEISVGDVEQAELKYYKKAQTKKRSKAVDYIDLLSVQLEQTATAVRLEMRAPNPAPWEGKDQGLVEAFLVVPESCSVWIDAAYFDITARGPLSGMTNTTSLGRLDISGVYGQVDLVTANRRIKLQNVAGEVSARTSNSTLLVRNVKCVGSQASFRNDGGDIVIGGIEGGLNVKTSYGRIDIEDFIPTGKRNYIRCSSGPIIVQIASMSEGQLMISNRYDDIELVVPSQLSAVMALAVDEDGKIEVSNFTFKTDLVQDNRLNLQIGEGEGLISCSVRGKGNIYVRGMDDDER